MVLFLFFIFGWKIGSTEGNIIFRLVSHDCKIPHFELKKGLLSIVG